MREICTLSILTIGRKGAILYSIKSRPTVENSRKMTGGILEKNKEGEKKMTYAELFSEIKGRFMAADVSGITEHLAYQFNITGEGEGIFYVEIKDGKLYVEPYEYFDRDAIFICSANTLLKMADKKLDPVMAFTLQKLKVEGNLDKALRFKELIDSYR